MVRAAKRRSRTRGPEIKKKKSQLPFTIHNYVLFAVGIVVLGFGYIVMNIGPVDSFWSLTLAPILLIIGYLIIIPLSIIYQNKSKKHLPDTQDKQQPTEPHVVR